MIEVGFFDALFTDETEQFRSPSEPDKGQTVTIRLRTAKNGAIKVILYLIEGPMERSYEMKKKSSDELFDFYEASFVCGAKRTDYAFFVDTKEKNYVYYKDGVQELISPAIRPDDSRTFQFTPGFHVPQWSKGAIQYQIFIDRFRNGCKSNDVTNHEYYYVNGHAWHMAWQTPVMDGDIHNFYGGDLQGVMEKLDYLQELGVEVLYFNPLFLSPSSHKYDTQDYDYIDPHLAVILEDEHHSMQDWEKHNGYASEYIKRVTSLKNLEASNQYFAEFCKEVHRRGMKIILDGVFNHCGSFNKWMDKEGIYVAVKEFKKGAFQSAESPYRRYFKFKNNEAHAAYEGWYNFETLPKLNYDDCPELIEAIMKVGEKWASEPYCIDGWRLDVAADLGHSPEFNHRFWAEFRRRVKQVNPNLVIIAEHYGDPTPWLQGDQWDTVMNYDAFMEPLTFFLTGMEKHSDGFSEELYQNGPAFFASMRHAMAKFQEPSLACAMNQLSNHDHSRFLTRTNHQVGRLVFMGTEAAEEGINKAVMAEAVTVQMTWPGAPTLYYGDEAGVTGWTDPDNRRTYPWGHEDKEMISLHHDLIALRKANKVLNTGSIKELASGTGLIAYGRFDAQHSAVVVCNNTENKRIEKIPVWMMGVKDGSCYVNSFSSDPAGHRCSGEQLTVKDGMVSVMLPEYSSVVLLSK